MKKIPHSWRKLPIKKRLEIPNNFFEIPSGEIKKIRKIKDGRNRLIAAAKLQYESFKDIHTDLTAWIAGYASDTAVRQKIGSSKKLREMFIEPSLKDKRFTPTWQDTKRNIKLPEGMNELLAEESGIHIGDGSLHIHTSKSGSSYLYGICGDLSNEYNYHVNHIASIMKKLYNCNAYYNIRTNRNAIESQYKSKLILEYKNRILRFPIGSKVDILIPKQVIGTKNFERRCLCGIFDTDFTLDNYAILKGRMASFKLMKQMCNLLSKQGVKYKYKKYEGYGYIRILQESTLKILEEWGLNNQKHVSKYQIWKETNKYFPFTSTTERLAFLEGKLGLGDLEDISEKRRKASARIKRFPLTLS